MSDSAFRGPHKVNYRTPVLGHNLSNRLRPSRYECIKNFGKTHKSISDVIVIHYSFFQKLCLIFKYFLSCLFPMK